MTYAIPEMNMESLEKKLTRIANKATKYGCDFHYEKIGEHFEEKTFSEEVGWDSAYNVPIYKHWKAIVRMIDIEVSGLAAVNGWKFAASLDYTSNGNIIKGTGEVEIPERYYSCRPWCEHCKTNRDRAHSYIVFNEDTKEFKQVGKSCLRDFTGGLSAEAVAQFESYIKEAEQAVTGGSWWAKTYFLVENFMVFLAETIRIFGYVRRGGHDVSTADRAEELYREANDMRVPQGKATQARLLEAKVRGFDRDNPASIELAHKVREWIVNNEKNDNYFHNLKVACLSERLDLGNLGLLASAFPAYDRELEKEAERREREEKAKEAAAKSSWMGNVGDRVSFEVAEYFIITSWETQWGTTTVYKFTSTNGQEATWKTSSWFEEEKVVGKIITGTVKEQKEWNGIKQTEITRCKISEKKVEEKKEEGKKKEEPGEDPREAFNLLDDLD